VLRDATWLAGINNGALSARALLSSAPRGQKLFVMSQPTNPRGFGLGLSSLTPMPAAKFLRMAKPTSLARLEQEDEASQWEDDFTAVAASTAVFATNVEDVGRESIDSQLSRLPQWLRWDGDATMLQHAPAPIGGMTGPQLYFKARGSWTGGHQENLCAASVNVNHGPGVSEWGAVAGDAVPMLREAALREFGFDILSGEGRYFPSLAWLDSRGIPHTFFRQHPGDVVLLEGHTVHFVASLGNATHSSWNMLLPHQVPMAAARAAANLCARMPLIVPLVNLSIAFTGSLRARRAGLGAGPWGSLPPSTGMAAAMPAAASVKPDHAGLMRPAPGPSPADGECPVSDDGARPARPAARRELGSAPGQPGHAGADALDRFCRGLVDATAQRELAACAAFCRLDGAAVSLSEQPLGQVYRCDNPMCLVEVVFAHARCKVLGLSRRRDKARAKRAREAASDSAPGHWTAGDNLDFDRVKSLARYEAMKASTDALGPKARAHRLLRRAADRRAAKASMPGVPRWRLMCVPCAISHVARTGLEAQLVVQPELLAAPCDTELARHILRRIPAPEGRSS